MSRHIDYKYTIWGRIHLPQEVTREEVENIIKEEPWGTQIFDKIVDNHPGSEPSFETLHDTEDRVTLEENHGFSTIEYYEDGTLIISNGIS